MCLMNSQYKINEKQDKCKILMSTNSLKLYLNIFIFYEDFNSILSQSKLFIYMIEECNSTMRNDITKLWKYVAILPEDNMPFAPLSRL